jgi:hypothetical protein
MRWLIALTVIIKVFYLIKYDILGIEMFRFENCTFFLMGTSMKSDDSQNSCHGRMILGVVSRTQHLKFFSSHPFNQNVYLKLLHAARLPGMVYNVKEFDSK